MHDIKHLLIVDDDKHLIKILSSYLTSEGFAVDSANDVYSALSLIKYNRPNLIISDIMMSRLDGYDLLKLLKRDQEIFKIPLIFLTAKGMTIDRIKGYNMGCHAYICKPFNPKELLSIIRNILTHIDLIYHYSKDTDYIIINNNKYIKFMSSLTMREKKILQLLIKGAMNKEISCQLNLSLRNIEKYVSKLLNKTGSRNRTELLKFVIDNHAIYKGE